MCGSFEWDWKRGKTQKPRTNSFETNQSIQINIYLIYTKTKGKVKEKIQAAAAFIDDKWSKNVRKYKIMALFGTIYRLTTEDRIQKPPHITLPVVTCFSTSNAQERKKKKWRRERDRENIIIYQKEKKRKQHTKNTIDLSKLNCFYLLSGKRIKKNQRKKHSSSAMKLNIKICEFLLFFSLFVRSLNLIPCIAHEWFLMHKRFFALIALALSHSLSVFWWMVGWHSSEINTPNRK